MKRILTFILVLTSCIGASAQTSLTQAVNFTSTAHHGEEIDLFEILDGGQYVLIDFFYTTCGPCKKALPSIVEAYHRLGCNQGDVYFMEITPKDNNNNSAIDAWIEEFNVPYPTIHTASEGDSGDEIADLYQIKAFPTLILISPRKTILFSDYYPESGDAMVEYLTSNYRIKEYECNEDDTVEPENPEETIVPATPVVSATAESTSSIKLTWNTIENALSYNIYVSDTILLANVSDTTFIADGLEYDTEYCFTAASVGKDTISTRSEKACTKTLGEGIDELTSSLNLYPNPVNDKLYIEADAEIEEFSIYDVYGRLQVTETPSHQGKVMVDVSELSNGVYFVKVKFGSDGVMKLGSEEVVRRILKF